MAPTNSKADGDMANAKDWKAGIRSLGPGAPSTEYFPFYGMDWDAASTEGLKFGGSSTPETTRFHAGKHDSQNGESIYDIAIALQYGQGTGSTQLLKFLSEHINLIHNPPYKDWKCILTAGNTSALDIVFRMLGQMGDYILVEEYTYPTVYETGVPMGYKFATVRMDELGIIPAELDSVLTNWSERERNGKKPVLLYTIPCGQNPSGATQPIERKHEIYAVAQKHGVYILEDDPYYFIQMPPYKSSLLPLDEKQSLEPETDSFPTSVEQFARALIPSYLSIDTDGRVFRMDSFSKIIAPGTRMGWVTASEQVIERMVRAHEVSVQNPSGFSQIAIFKLLHDTWGHVGFVKWLRHLQKEYTRRRNTMFDSFERYLPHQVVTWNPPTAGFFAWISIDWKKHPSANDMSAREIEQEIYKSAIEHNTLVVPGSWFMPSNGENVPMEKIFFRLNFASVSLETVQEAIKGLGIAIRKTFCLRQLEQSL
ncbi:Pyridoxal phosphate-dependent transferase, major region, subdomain 2 [Penicillium expansum]|uniref:Pyridoxal phosphate-dependent transferase, major region, subdomain 2 n=1 Tax=Penicillium expansum TaxID=27334 RepID=A0A0A2J945_PENEN|nr:Pyridoxal phosphate-dependent transferase, major region, subdomain 2 [Penicillium expansum]KGO51296.1 Pyridoxal phosphate-dependent transferase, major region, subdomain 2 [Penicillium expansum]